VTCQVIGISYIEMIFTLQSPSAHSTAVACACALCSLIYEIIISETK
jgi:hypothetical protein